MGRLETTLRGLDHHYVGVSPQLLARVRQSWIAQRLDLDAVWRESVQTLPGYGELGVLPVFADSRPIDLLLLFDQACCWVDAVRRAAAMLDGRAGARLSPEQARGLVAVTTRLRDELAAVRTLALAGLAMPAMQISRSISEDVDLVLAIMVRRRLAQAFVECRTPENAAEFWRNHVAGGRAFRLVAQALYRFGLDYSDDSEYVRWRKEVLVFLGSAVHTSFIGTATDDTGGSAGPLNPAAQECLYFATMRVQEMCAYALVIGGDFKTDIAGVAPTDALSESQLRFVRDGGEIIIDQMRWLTGSAETPHGRFGRPVH